MTPEQFQMQERSGEKKKKEKMVIRNIPHFLITIQLKLEVSNKNKLTSYRNRKTTIAAPKEWVKEDILKDIGLNDTERDLIRPK